MSTREAPGAQAQGADMVARTMGKQQDVTVLDCSSDRWEDSDSEWDAPR